jgi:IS5 family transposase
MSKQISFAQAEYDAKRKTTRRDRFLAEMEIVVPGRGCWNSCVRMIIPRRAWVRVGRRSAWNGCCASTSSSNGLVWPTRRWKMPSMTARRFAAFSASTKHQARARDPDRGHTRKGKQYFFGAKAHIGVDAESGWVHSTTTTAANVADITATGHLLHGEEEAVCADAGYTGAEKREELKDRQVKGYIAAKRGKVAALPEGEVKDLTKRMERIKAHVRSRVEHVFPLIKDRFHSRKLRYQGLKKNGAQQEVLFALANLIIAKKALLAA